MDDNQALVFSTIGFVGGVTTADVIAVSPVAPAVTVGALAWLIEMQFCTWSSDRDQRRYYPTQAGQTAYAAWCNKPK